MLIILNKFRTKNQGRNRDTSRAKERENGRFCEQLSPSFIKFMELFVFLTF